MSDQSSNPRNDASQNGDALKASSQRCAHQHGDATFCGRWPSAGSRFCYLHRQAHGEAALPGHALNRLSTPADLFDVIREALNAVRLGRIQPGQAYAVGYLANLWLQVFRHLSCEDREAALQGGALPEFAAHDADSLAAAAAPVEPLPPSPDSPILEALEERQTDQPLPFPFSLMAPDPRLDKRGVKKRIIARLMNELGKSASENIEVKRE